MHARDPLHNIDQARGQAKALVIRTLACLQDEENTKTFPDRNGTSPKFPVKEWPIETAKRSGLTGFRAKLACCFSVGLRLGLSVVLLELAIESRFADAQQACCGELVSPSLAQGAQDRTPLEFFEGQKFVVLRHPVAGAVLEV